MFSAILYFFATLLYLIDAFTIVFPVSVFVEKSRFDIDFSPNFFVYIFETFLIFVLPGCTAIFFRLHSTKRLFYIVLSMFGLALVLLLYEWISRLWWIIFDLLLSEPKGGRDYYINYYIDFYWFAVYFIEWVIASWYIFVFWKKFYHGWGHFA